ncbi:MAG: dihydroorotate dehydrogenase electron transfer subunit [Candidatus Delongbacteria bacterium]
MTLQRRQERLAVREIRGLGADQFQLILERGPDAGIPAFRAGQFAQLAVPGHTLPRPFSILRAGTDQLEFLVKVVGPGTAWLADRRPGEQVSVLWPLGHGFLDRLPADADPAEEGLLVGGGVGIAPLIALWEQEAGRRPLRAAFGFRDRPGVAAARALQPELAMEISTEDGSVGRAGRVTDLLADWLAEAPERPRRIYCCGPEPMMEAVARHARAAGVPCLLSLETLMGCGIGICVGCAVPVSTGGFQLACQAGPVFALDELADSEPAREACR